MSEERTLAIERNCLAREEMAIVLNYRTDKCSMDKWRWLMASDDEHGEQVRWCRGSLSTTCAIDIRIFPKI